MKDCLWCRMPRNRHPLSYCPNFICEHNFVKSLCSKCNTPEYMRKLEASRTKDEPGR